MPQPLSGIDHVIVGVDDLERARIAWTRLGFTLTPRGRHLQKGTGNYCIMFERDYLELMGVVDPAQGVGRAHKKSPRAGTGQIVLPELVGLP